jgi:predicted enzyme related to lactoylglutathione lyase
MARILGVGGIFIHADDPAALAGWYARCFGLTFRDDAGPEVFYTVFAYRDEQNPGIKHDTTFAIFPALGGERSGRPDYTINYRVDDLDSVVAHLNQFGITTEEVSIKRDEEGYGKFTGLHDLEGNRIELYEPLR